MCALWLGLVGLYLLLAFAPFTGTDAKLARSSFRTAPSLNVHIGNVPFREVINGAMSGETTSRIPL
jgi:hypothetical protein